MNLITERRLKTDLSAFSHIINKFRGDLNGSIDYFFIRLRKKEPKYLQKKR